MLQKFKIKNKIGIKMYSECSSLTRCSFIVKLHDCDSDSFTADLRQDEDYLILNGRVTFTGNKFHFCCPIKVLIHRPGLQDEQILQFRRKT